MSISSVTSSFANYAKNVTSGSAPSSSSSTQGSAAQEANETLAQTTKEARGGDHVAKVKLAKLETAKQISAPSAPASEPGKGTQVDRTA